MDAEKLINIETSSPKLKLRERHRNASKDSASGEQDQQSLNIQPKRRRLADSKKGDPYNLPAFPNDLRFSSFQQVHKELKEKLHGLSDKDSFIERREIINQLLQDNNAINKWLWKNFSSELKNKKDKWPSEWMYKYKSIGFRLKDPKDKVFAKVLPLLNFLWAKRLNYPRSVELAEKINAGYHHKIETQNKGKDDEITQEVKRCYVFIQELNFKDMETALGFSRFIIRTYMLEFVKLGILKKFKKSGPNSQMVYAIGYYHPYGKNNQMRPISFLKNTKEFREALSDFNPY